MMIGPKDSTTEDTDAKQRTRFVKRKRLTSVDLDSLAVTSVVEL